MSENNIRSRFSKEVCSKCKVDSYPRTMLAQSQCATLIIWSQLHQ